MPNRIIKESICRSDSIDSLSWFEEVLFYRLIVVCDDYGRFDGRPAIIKGACFPLKDIRVEQIEKALNKLSTVGMIWRYNVGDRAFLQLIAWEKHQQRRAKNSKYPAPETQCNHMISHDIKCPRGIEESRNEESRNGDACAREGEVRRFDKFFESYPNKQRRHLAEQAYCDLILSGSVGEDELIRAARNYAAYIKESGSMAYYPNNFLEKCVFEDYLEVKKPEAPKTEEPEAEQEEELIGEDEEWWKYGPNGWEE